MSKNEVAFLDDRLISANQSCLKSCQKALFGWRIKNDPSKNPHLF